MSKYESKCDGNEVCPYCMNEWVPDQDLGPNERVAECDECGKKYYCEPEYSVDYHTKPDCELNGEQHDFVLVPFGNAYCCNVCGKYKLIEGAR